LQVEVGHGGTLDPLAIGVLVIRVGTGYRQLEDYLRGRKAYTCRATLGAETDTLDSSGVFTDTAPWEHVSATDLEGALPRFCGDIMQVMHA
ncbi:unnamed protein product, partial [Phaeothamnion confervicola]